MTQSAEESNGDSTNATPDDVVEHSDLNGCMFGLNDSEHCNTHLSKVVDDSLSIALDISYDALSG